MKTSNGSMRDVDPELIAKVLEGRATPEERAYVLARADESPELLAILADAAAAMEDTAPAKTLVFTGRGRGVRQAALIAIAAVVAFVIAVPVMQSRSGPPAFGGLAEGMLAAGAGARDGAVFSRTRGESDEAFKALSVRAGARTMDYMILSAGRDTAATTAAIEIIALLRGVAGGSAAAAQFEAVPASPNRVTALAAAISSMEQVLDARAFRQAAWIELARLAAMQRDSAVLSGRELRQGIRATAKDGSISEAVRDDARRLAELASSPNPSWAEIEQLCSRLLMELSTT